MKGGRGVMVTTRLPPRFHFGPTNGNERYPAGQACRPDGFSVLKCLRSGWFSVEAGGYPRTAIIRGRSIGRTNRGARHHAGAFLRGASEGIARGIGRRGERLECASPRAHQGVDGLLRR
jgi:hypothetical protein